MKRGFEGGSEGNGNASGKTGFALDEQVKAQKLEHIRRRLQAATPATSKPPRRVYEWDMRRTAMALFLALIFVLAIVAGSGVFL